MNPKKSEQTLWDHIFILRRYVAISLLSIVFGAGATHYFHKDIIEMIFRPLGGVDAVFLSPLDPFIFIYKIDLFGGLILALPVIIICTFLFVAPAFNSKRIWVYFFAFFTLSLLLVAGAIAYTFLLLIPLSLGFLLSIQIPGIENSFTAQNYLNFVITQLAMSVSIAFIPLAILFATLIHVLNPYNIGGKRGIVYVGMTIILAFLSPTTDLYTLLILLVPAVGIFEVSIIIAKIIYSFQQKKHRL
jgi:sec-independent protein translocase protein TatC